MSGEAAIAAANAFQDAFNILDSFGMADACNFPHVRLAKGIFTRFETREYFLKTHASMKERLKAEG